VHARALATSLVLLAPLFLVSASAAGDDQSTAIVVGEGTSSDYVAGYAEKWYKVDVPEGKVLRVAYAIASGDSWSDLEVRDSDGAYVTYADNGTSAAYDPDEASAWLKVDGFWSEVSYTFTVSFTDAPAQNDAGSGHDAGQRLASATPIVPGRIEGTLRRGAGDHDDWYRLDATAGTLIDGAVHADVDIYSPSGDRIGAITDYDSPYTPRAFSMLSDGLPVYLRTQYSYPDDYAFVATTTAPSDLQADAVSSRSIELVTEPAPTAIAYAREVSVEISNVGAGASRAAQVEVRAVHDGLTSYRVVGTRSISLAPGERVTVTMPWDTTGEVGDVTLVALVTGQFDRVAANNEAREQTSVLAAGSPIDADVLNHDVLVTDKETRIQYGGDKVGAQTPAGFAGSDHGTVHVG
jgi:hypothetical protein